ncbi:transporter [Bacteroidia bacterium]|nr:transporter [Bacteroidia bacterium]
MLASNPVKELEGVEEDLDNVFYDSQRKTKFLKSAVIYGANGSGKSNLLAAINFFKMFIQRSSERLAEDEINVTPFLFSSETENQPSSFEMVFMIDKTRYRYGFEATKKEIVSEWLFILNSEITTKESYCFTREYQEIKVNSKTFKEGKGVEQRTRRNVLFLSSVAQWNGEKALAIQKWFFANMNVISGINNDTEGYTMQKFLENTSFRKRIINFIKLADVGIEDIRIEEEIISGFISKIPVHKQNENINLLIDELQKSIDKELVINAYHNKQNEVKNIIGLIGLKFEMESAGTRKLFALLGPWFDTLENGNVLIIDELDCSMHTKLTTELIKVFQSKANKTNAQLIFTTHDTNLLRNDLFRRDQIWFTEKNNETGNSDLYSLVEYKINQAASVRNDASFGKDYLLGKYGAIPYFGNISQFINDFAKDIEHE